MSLVAVLFSITTISWGMLAGAFMFNELQASQDTILSHEFFRTPFVGVPPPQYQNKSDFSMHILFGNRRLTTVASPFISSEPTGYITASFYFDEVSTCSKIPTMKVNAMGICFADFSTGGSMMFTTPGVSVDDQMLFYQHYYTTQDCSGGALTRVQYLNTKCLAAKYSDPKGEGSPFIYSYSVSPPSIDDYGLLLT
jgi:hypothetical protein